MFFIVEFLDFPGLFNSLHRNSDTISRTNNTSLKAIGGKEWKREDSQVHLFFLPPSSAVMIPKELSCCKEEEAPLKKTGTVAGGSILFHGVQHTFWSPSVK